MKENDYYIIENICNLANDLLDELKHINSRYYSDDLYDFIFENLNEGTFSDPDDFLKIIKEDFEE